jgi:hypothetical protein
MTAYEIMIKSNHYLIKGGKLTEKQKDNIVNQLLSVKNTPEQAKQFYDGVKFPNNIDDRGRKMYPIFYIPPYNDGKKLKTIFNQTPKTHILSANMYELEILRLLYLLEPENADVKVMIIETLKRLKTTCFGYHDDGLGECFDTSLVVLRFISTVAKDEIEWIKSRIDNYNNHANEKKRPWFASWYFWLCLSEMPFTMAKPEIEKYKDVMLNWLCNKSCVMNSEHDKTIHPVIISMLRNIIAKYPEYEYIKDREPYVYEKDGRLYFNITAS